MKLDNTDVRILKVLQENGRLSFRQIADRVKVSVPTVSSKVGSMENMGIIKGYTATLDPEKLGGISVVLSIKTKPVDIKKVAEQFQENESVRQIFMLSSGKLMLMCTFHHQHLINEFLSKMADIHEIIEFDIANIVTVVKENQRATVTPESSVVLTCDYCKKEIHDNAYKVKKDDREYYVCCPVCQKGFEVKYDGIKADSVKVKA
jgi:Lrp/AsnC family leucine-responsive transcriptional regulator